MTIRRKVTHTLTQLLGFYQEYSDAALWEEELAARLPPGAARERALVRHAKLYGAAKGYLFRASELATEQTGFSRRWPAS